MSLADDWISPDEGYPRAKQAAERALKLEPSLAEAHTARGKVLGWYDWDFDAAELALRRAVATSPNYPDAHWGLATILPANGQLEEGLEEMRTALALDPLSASFAAWVARFLFYLRRYDQAIYQAQRALELDPSLPRGFTYVGYGHLARGEPEIALEIFRKGAEHGGVLSMKAYVAQALAALDRREEARAQLAELESEAADGYVRGEYVAGAYAALGEMDAAFAALDRALEARSAGLIYLHVDPSYDPLRGDPRYDRLIKAIGVR
jgi:tetratricopeptide (TPR) repeat protein